MKTNSAFIPLNKLQYYLPMHPYIHMTFQTTRRNVPAEPDHSVKTRTENLKT